MGIIVRNRESSHCDATTTPPPPLVVHWWPVGVWSPTVSAAPGLGIIVGPAAVVSSSVAPLGARASASMSGPSLWGLSGCRCCRGSWCEVLCPFPTVTCSSTFCGMRAHCVTSPSAVAVPVFLPAVLCAMPSSVMVWVISGPLSACASTRSVVLFVSVVVLPSIVIVISSVV